MLAVSLLGVCLSAAAVLQGAPAAGDRAQERYAAASIEADGRLRITADSQRNIFLTRDEGQKSWGTPVLSADRRAVGVPALYSNCCTSYDLPLALVVYSGGTSRQFRGNGLPIFQWAFADQGTRVAYGQQPAHSGCSIHYELRDIASGHLIEAADVPEPCGEHPSPRAMQLPGWVTALRENTR